MWESVVVVFIVVMVIAIFAVATTREEEGETMRKKVDSRKEERDRPNRHDMEPWREPICALECMVQAQQIDIDKLKKQGAKIMGELQDVKNAIAQVKTDLATEKAEVAAEIQRLKDQIGQGSPVTPADLDELITSVKEIGQGVQDIFTPGT